MALTSQGTVVAWGLDADGQRSVPAGLTGVTAITAGGCHSLALTSQGTVVAWGWNSDGQCSVQAVLTGVTAIAAGRRPQPGAAGEVTKAPFYRQAPRLR